MDYLFLTLSIFFILLIVYIYYKISIQKKIIILDDKDLSETPLQVQWVLKRDDGKCQFDWVDITDRENRIVCGVPSNEIYVVKVRLLDPFFRGNDFPFRSITVCETHKNWLIKSTNIDLALKINLKATNLTKKYLIDNPKDIFPE